VRRSLLRRWLTSVAWGAATGLCALLLLTYSFEPFGASVVPWLLNLLALPGLLFSILLGASPHGGGFGDARDWFVTPLGCGLVWGTMLFGLRSVLARRTDDMNGRGDR
jgi:hypothetical protein